MCKLLILLTNVFQPIKTGKSTNNVQKATSLNMFWKRKRRLHRRSQTSAVAQRRSTVMLIPRYFPRFDTVILTHLQIHKQKNKATQAFRNIQTNDDCYQTVAKYVHYLANLHQRNSHSPHLPSSSPTVLKMLKIKLNWGRFPQGSKSTHLIMNAKNCRSR